MGVVVWCVLRANRCVIFGVTSESLTTVDPEETLRGHPDANSPTLQQHLKPQDHGLAAWDNWIWLWLVCLVSHDACVGHCSGFRIEHYVWWLTYRSVPVGHTCIPSFVSCRASRGLFKDFKKVFLPIVAVCLDLSSSAASMNMVRTCEDSIIHSRGKKGSHTESVLILILIKF